MITRIQKADRKVNSLIEEKKKPYFTQLFKSITGLGSVYVTGILLALFLAFENYLIAFDLFTGLAIISAAIYSLKFLVKRKRPKKHVENLLTRSSFPSGHSANAFMNASILGFHLGNTLLFSVLAGFIALSRVYLEDHYLSDILVGSFIGIIIGQILITV